MQLEIYVTFRKIISIETSHAIYVELNFTAHGILALCECTGIHVDLKEFRAELNKASFLLLKSEQLITRVGNLTEEMASVSIFEFPTGVFSRKYGANRM
jgi:hypothetical protein